MAVAKPVVKNAEEQYNNEPRVPVEEETSKVYYRLTNKGDLEITDTNVTLTITKDQFAILHGMLYGNVNIPGSAFWPANAAMMPASMPGSYGPLPR